MRLVILGGLTALTIGLVTCSGEPVPTAAVFLAPDCTARVLEPCEPALLMFQQSVGPPNGPIGPLGTFRRIEVGDVVLIGRISAYGCAAMTVDVAFDGLSPEGWPRFLTEDGLKVVNMGPATSETPTQSFRLAVDTPAVVTPSEPCT